VARGVARGRLPDAARAPAADEEVARLLELDGLVIEHILSGRLDAPVDYLQDEDEWVVLLAGSATLVVDGEDVELSAGEWLFLPAGTPHTLVRVEPGSSWLAVHARQTSPPR
jgi:cupin 2 domain-containing protein